MSPTGWPFPRADVRHRYAIGDVHGCCRTLRAMVEEGLRLGRHDTLFLLGDLIDRGPDSSGVLEYLLNLRADGHDIRPLMGNHEELCLKAAAGDVFAERVWYANGGAGTLMQFGVERPRDIPARYLDFMAALPLIAIEPEYVLVHAGLDFATGDPLGDTSPQVMLWDRTTGVQPRNIGGRTLVCGHTVTPLDGIRGSLATRVIRLDNGCFLGRGGEYGSLVALNLDTRQLLVQQNVD